MDHHHYDHDLNLVKIKLSYETIETLVRTIVRRYRLHFVLSVFELRKSIILHYVVD